MIITRDILEAFKKWKISEDRKPILITMFDTLSGKKYVVASSKIENNAVKEDVKPQRYRKPWTPAEEDKLENLFCEDGYNIRQMAEILQRTPGGVIMRMNKLFDDWETDDTYTDENGYKQLIGFEN